MKTNHTYIGKTIFVGIDVHKKTYSVAVVCDKQLIKRDTMPALPQKLVDYLKKYFAGARIFSAYEAGFSEQSAFSRDFKNWSNQSPAEFRKSL